MEEGVQGESGHEDEGRERKRWVDSPCTTVPFLPVRYSRRLSVIMRRGACNHATMARLIIGMTIVQTIVDRTQNTVLP
jgi:hypothetical protein